MSGFQTRQTQINESNIKIFTEKFSANISLQSFTNQLFEKYFKEKLIELNDANFRAMNDLSSKQKTTSTQVVNLILESYEWQLEETPKQRITLDMNKKKIKPTKKAKQTTNVITQF